jgi:glycosyltransferase involved in cell wall biosynthesis
MKFVLWQGILSMHQSAYIRALAQQNEVTIVAQSGLHAEQVHMGWFVPDMGRVQVITNPDADRIQSTFLSCGSDAIHIISGVRKNKLNGLALQECLTRGLRTGLMTEKPDTRGLKGRLKPYLYKYQKLKWSHGLQFIIAMGQRGITWYKQIGYHSSMLYPFAYITESVKSNRNYQPQSSDVVEIVYIGRCIQLKGVDIALKALAQLLNYKWSFTIVGDGSEKPAWQKLAANLGLNSRVKFLPAMPNIDALSLLETMDVLILPSRSDGWGAVVNEALMHGVPVICSDQCGAVDLLREPWRGYSFQLNPTNDLIEKLRLMLDRGKKKATDSERIMKWSECIQGQAAAAYFESIFSHIYNQTSCPIPPWCVDKPDHDQN